MRPMSSPSYELQVKVLDGAAHQIRSTAQRPWHVNRYLGADRDPGRPWSGDLCETISPTDPAEAYAAYKGTVTDQGVESEVEAWVDRGSDGTIIGWVRQGDEVWRYTDPEAWALDVDGADLQLVSSDPDKPIEEMADAVDSTSAEDQVEDLEQTDGSTVKSEVDTAEKELTDPAGDEAAEQDVPDTVETDTPDDLEPAAVDDPAEPSVDDEEDDEDEPSKPWEKKSLRLVVRPKA